jgi:hypothetical protein
MILTGSTIIVLMDEENEEEREKVTCPGSPVESMVEQRFKIFQGNRVILFLKLPLHSYKSNSIVLGL